MSKEPKKKTVRRTGKRKPTSYVSNKELREEIVRYKKEKQDCADAGKPTPQMSDKLGEMIMLIANRLATLPNFSGYTYTDEMISDGIENTLMYITNFDPEKSENAFAYVTQIIYFAFIRRIQREKKQTYIKLIAMEQEGIYGFFQDIDRDKWEKSKKIETYKKGLGLSTTDINNFDSKNKRRRASTRKKTGIEECQETE